MPESWLWMAALATGGWIYWSGMRVREIAEAAGRDYCRNIGVQFLDESVSRDRLWFARDGGGMMRFSRLYGFEFTSDGERRYRGEIRMLGREVSGISVQLHRMLH